ncbi:MAG: AAA family ATPase [Planctomycetota bacterium]
MMTPKTFVPAGGTSNESDAAPPRSLTQVLADFGISTSATLQSKCDGASGQPPASPDVTRSARPVAAGGATAWLPKRHVPEAARSDSQLSALFDRVEALLGSQTSTADEQFIPRVPDRLEETGLSADDVERLMLKYLLSKGSSTGRAVAQQVRLPFGIIDPLLKGLKYDQLLAFVGTAEMGDYEYSITEMGRERARRYIEECTYFGSAPVSLRDYLKAMERQSISKQQVTEHDLKQAFSDLLIGPDLLDQLGPAINSGRGMFLFGAPGNGKTSIAERITQCFGSSIWIPRALGIDGDIIRLYDPGVHEEVKEESNEGIFDLSGIDPRWVRIVRPTVIAGGELTMEELEVCQNHQTKICEAPLQLKSNCGTLVIDDFGRQRMPVTELLNRWIVPLEKRYDFLNLPSGKKIQVPFDQLIIFSTNLEPRELVDGAFLRRIPYKIQVPDPTEAEFREILRRLSPKLGFQYDDAAVEHLIEQHYRRTGRPMRSCQPRDLLLQVRNFCTYKQHSRKLTPAAFDFAVANYFSVL